MRARAAGRSACLSSPRAALSLIARSLVLVGLRSCASLRAGLHRRLHCRVVSYSIPDDTMRITGSCGIRLIIHSACFPVVVSVMRAMWSDFLRIVPLLVPSGGSPLSPACLMFAAVCLDTRLRRLVNRATCVSTRSSTPLHLVIDVGAAAVPSHGFSPSAPPHRHDERGDTDVVAAVLAFACLTIDSLSHPCGSASDGDGCGACPVP